MTMSEQNTCKIKESAMTVYVHCNKQSDRISLTLNLRVIDRYFFSQNRWPSLIICIDLFVVY